MPGGRRLSAQIARWGRLRRSTSTKPDQRTDHAHDENRPIAEMIRNQTGDRPADRIRQILERGEAPECRCAHGATDPADHLDAH